MKIFDESRDHAGFIFPGPNLVRTAGRLTEHLNWLMFIFCDTPESRSIKYDWTLVFLYNPLRTHVKLERYEVR